ncbi:MAG: tetratricopeptide repeat protein [Chloroherpetonaceae bacterium]|nr:tetratricopeptide repeat protein [Chloroherpetonaceae bacterium]
MYSGAGYLIFVLSLLSCESTDDSIMGKVYHNFTGYFNAFHNAKLEYERGIIAIRTTQDYSKKAKLTIFPSLENAASGKQFFDNVIRKTSIVLQAHAASDLSDDALLLLGKAYYHQKEFQPAERKFKEILSNYPEGDVVDEATFWYGRTLAAMQIFEEARAVLGSVILSEKSSPNVRGEAHFVLAQLALSDNDFAETTRQIELGIPLVKDYDLRARAAFVLARVYDQIGDFKKAAESYKLILTLDPNFDLKYTAELSYGIDLREQKVYDEAIRVFEDMLGDDKNFEKFGDIRYELAECYTQIERLGVSINLYLEIIRKSPRTESAAKSFFRLGRIRQEISRDYEAAKALYDTARVQYPQGEIAQEAKIASERVEKILWLYETIGTLDSTIQLGVVAVTKESKMVDSLKEAKRIQDSLALTQGTSSLLNRRKRFEYRRTFFVSMGFRDAFNEIASVGNQLVLRSKERKTYKTAPDTSTLYNYKFELLNRYSEIASFFHFTLPIPDSAIYWYKFTVKKCTEEERKFPDSLAMAVSRLKETCLFSLSDVYRSMNNAVVQDSLFQIILKSYPKGRYSNRIRVFYNLPMLSEIKPDEALYAKAVEATNDRNAKRAFQLLDSLQSFFPKSSFIPKAILAKGYLFETELRNRDSALTEYQLLASRFPDSPEFNTISEKLKIWEAYLNGIDSSKSIKPTSSDSSKAPNFIPLNDSLKSSSLPNKENSVKPPGSISPAILPSSPSKPERSTPDTAQSKSLFSLPSQTQQKSNPPQRQNPKK